MLDKAGDQWTLVDDCRALFPPLTSLVGLFAAGGDGQEAMPDQPLPQLLRVSAPMPGSRVRFTADGNGVVAGSVAAAAGATDHILIVTTGDDRVAACGWKLDPAGDPSQTLTAELLDAADQPVGVPIVFDGGLSVAAQVAYDPSNCDNLANAGVTTVQEAIDVLCKTQGEDDGIHVGRVTLRGVGADLRNDTNVPVDALREGIEVDFDGPIAPEAIKDKPVMFVTIELPYPLLPAEREFWKNPGVVAFQPLVLAADLGAGDTTIVWRPQDATIQWLENVLAMLSQIVPGGRLLARLTLQGNFVWSEKDDGLWIDGDSFGTRGGGNTDLFMDDNGLLSGDGRRGGDFRMWFWLVREGVVDTGPKLDTLDMKDVIVAGTKARARVRFTAPAPPEGIVVTVRTDRPDIVKVPDQVTVAAGASEVLFMVVAGLPPGAATANATLGIEALSETREVPFRITKSPIILPGPNDPGPVIHGPG